MKNIKFFDYLHTYYDSYLDDKHKNKDFLYIDYNFDIKNNDSYARLFQYCKESEDLDRAKINLTNFLQAPYNIYICFIKSKQDYEELYYKIIICGEEIHAYKISYEYLKNFRIFKKMIKQIIKEIKEFYKDALRYFLIVSNRRDIQRAFGAYECRNFLGKKSNFEEIE